MIFPSTYLLSILCFCRLLIATTFFLALVGKLSNMVAFQRTVSRFAIFPKSINTVFSKFIILAEFVVLLTLCLGGDFMAFGFVLAVLLLAIFLVAIMIVIKRKTIVACNCFGPGNKDITTLDAWRNILLITAGLLGWLAMQELSGIGYTIDAIEYVLCGFAVLLSLGIWMGLRRVKQSLQYK